jgi:hypothetical protein
VEDGWPAAGEEFACSGNWVVILEAEDLQKPMKISG